MSNVTPQQLFRALKKYYNEAELEVLAFSLEIPYEDLGGKGRSGKALAMVQYAQRHGKYDELIQELADSRPELDWDVPESSAKDNQTRPSSQADPQPQTVYHVYGNMSTGDTHIGGDNITGGDKVGGDKTEIGDISNSSGLAVGEGASADVKTQTTEFQDKVIGSAFDGGTVDAENIAGESINISTKQEFQEQLAALETLIQEAIANGEIPADEAEAVKDDVQDTVKEAAREKPIARRLTSRLEYVQEVLDKSAGVAQAAGKAGSTVLKAAPIVASLLKAASVLF